MYKEKENDCPAILIVADNVELNNLISSKLSYLNSPIICMRNGIDAISRVNGCSDALFILDYKLPDMTVKEFLAEISLSANFPIIVMIDYPDVKAAAELMELGAKDYLIKDSRFIDLLPNLINRVLKELSLEKRLEQAENTLMEREEKHKIICDNALVGIISINVRDKHLISVNEFGRKMLGYESKDEIIERIRTDSIAFFIEMPGNILRELEGKNEILNQEIQIKRKDGLKMWCMISARLYPDKDTVEIVFSDITKRKEAEERIYNLTYYDQLTKLPNKELFKTNLQNEIKKAEGRGKRDIFAVVCIGIDKFKNINNIYGTEIANSLLIQLGIKLQKNIFKNDTVSRIEGDRFMILFSDIASRDDLGGVIRKIHDVFSGYFIVDSMQLVLSATVGICIFPEDGTNANVLIKNSEAAVDMARERGIKTHFFDADLNAEVIHYFRIIGDLKEAISNKEFITYYQPKVTFDGRIVGMESLIRWQSPKRGLVFPLEFIPIAEKNNMIVEIENIIFKESCLQNKKWQDMGCEPVKVAVNLSPYHLNRPGLISDIKLILSETGLSPEWLELEITESGIIENEKDSIAKIDELHQMGVSVSIDDFGTGYSSLSKLKDYPVDTLKIDKFFVESIPFDEKSETMAKTIIDMAHNLGFKVVAEGVESREQLDFLVNHSCDYYQGYYFSKPLPPEHFFKKTNK